MFGKIDQYNFTPEMRRKWKDLEDLLFEDKFAKDHPQYSEETKRKEMHDSFQKCISQIGNDLKAANTRQALDAARLKALLDHLGLEVVEVHTTEHNVFNQAVYEVRKVNKFPGTATGVKKGKK